MKLETVAKLGVYVGKATESTKRKFYDACATYIGDREGKQRTAYAEKIANAITREGKTSPPSVNTIVKFAGFARRFPDLPDNVSLEVAAKFAAQAADDATFDWQDDDGKTHSVPLTSDQDAVNAVTAYMAAQNIDTLSIRDARNMFASDTAKAETPAKNEPIDVGDAVAFLLSQPKAVVAWMNDNATNGALATELVDLLSPVVLNEDAA